MVSPPERGRPRCDAALALDRPHEAATFLGTVLGRPQGPGDQAEVDRLVGLMDSALRRPKRPSRRASASRSSVCSIDSLQPVQGDPCETIVLGPGGRRDAARERSPARDLGCGRNFRGVTVTSRRPP
jgi:hypothetical protein